MRYPETSRNFMTFWYEDSTDSRPRTAQWTLLHFWEILGTLLPFDLPLSLFLFYHFDRCWKIENSDAIVVPKFLGDIFRNVQLFVKVINKNGAGESRKLLKIRARTWAIYNLNKKEHSSQGRRFLYELENGKMETLFNLEFCYWRIRLINIKFDQADWRSSKTILTFFGGKRKAMFS